MKWFLLGAAAAVCLAAPAAAADIPLKVPSKVVAAAHGWTGCHIGVNGGYGWQQAHDADVVASNGGSVPSAGTFRPQGGFAGGQLGCNHQSGSVVLGIEADIQVSRIGSSFGPNLLALPAPLTVSGTENLRWFGTVRGRLGWAADRVLLYATGGLAFGRTSYSVSAVDGGLNTVSMTSDTARLGFAVGAGLEWAISGSWSVKAEYQYIDLGRIGPLNGTVLNPGGAPNGVTTTTAPFRNNYSTIRVGANYRFGGPFAAR